MILRAFLFSVLVVFTSRISFSQLIIKEAEFTSKTVLSKIFKGEFLNDENVQKWPISSVQALEYSGYVDANNYSYTSIDTIINLNVDTTNYKIVVLATFQVDSSGRIQDYMFSQIQIGLAYFEKRESDFYLINFNTDLLTTTIGSQPKTRIQQIGPYRYAIAFKEEIVQDNGKEIWFEIFNELFPFLAFDYQFLEYSDKTILFENYIEKIQTENEYFDFILNYTRTEIGEYENSSSDKKTSNKINLGFQSFGIYNQLIIPNANKLK
jgi:hypothetical protein